MLSFLKVLAIVVTLPLVFPGAAHSIERSEYKFAFVADSQGWGVKLPMYDRLTRIDKICHEFKNLQIQPKIVGLVASGCRLKNLITPASSWDEAAAPHCEAHQEWIDSEKIRAATDEYHLLRAKRLDSEMPMNSYWHLIFLRKKLYAKESTKASVFNDIDIGQRTPLDIVKDQSPHHYVFMVHGNHSGQSPDEIKQEVHDLVAQLPKEAACTFLISPSLHIDSEKSALMKRDNLMSLYYREKDLETQLEMDRDCKSEEHYDCSQLDILQKHLIWTVGVQGSAEHLESNKKRFTLGLNIISEVNKTGRCSAIEITQSDQEKYFELGRNSLNYNYLSVKDERLILGQSHNLVLDAYHVSHLGADNYLDWLNPEGGPAKDKRLCRALSRARELVRQ